MKNLLAIALLSLTSYANSLSLAYMPMSTHLTECEEIKCNAHNNVIAIEHNSFMAFRMKNSYYKESYFLGRKFDLDVTANISFSHTYGFVSGYDSDLSYGKVTPAAFASVDIHPEHDNYGLFVVYMPTSAFLLGARITF